MGSEARARCPLPADMSARHCAQGLDTALVKEIVRLIKERAQGAEGLNQDDGVHCAGRKKDDLKYVIALRRESKLELPPQFRNVRD